MSNLRIYCDGSSNGRTGSKTGYGFVVTLDDSVIDVGYGSNAAGTNNTAELSAAIMSTRWILNNPEYSKGTVISDSTYVVNGITDWVHGWNKRGWTAKGWGKKVPKCDANGRIKNYDLWYGFYRVVYEVLPAKNLTVNFEWVKGHNGNKWNEVADGLATNARDGKVKEYIKQNNFPCSQCP